MPASTATQQHNSECDWKRTRLRVPREDNSIFMRPSLSEAIQTAEQNHTLLNRQGTPVLGQALDQFRSWARLEVLQAAGNYTQALLKPFPCACHDEHQLQLSDIPTDKCLLYVSGHQPALFHPGVWIKNFGIHSLAKQTDGVALNLIVDNDTMNSSSIFVPTTAAQLPTLTSIPFDAPHQSQPWENVTLADKELFRSFSLRVAEKMSAWGIDPLLNKIWADAVAMSEQTTLLRDCLTVARHRQERRFGLHNLELPISRLCELDCFMQFALHIIEHHTEFQQVHNQVLNEYRNVYQLRSKTHPVPELVQFDDGWVEVPFWVWRKEDATRSRLRVKCVQEKMLFSAGDGVIGSYTISDTKENGYARAALESLQRAGWLLRTRALTTTLFSRICFADLFVHGIGGAKYDEMTDQIIKRFFKITAPGFMTMSATKYLPFAEPYAVSSSDEREIRAQLRRMHYNPEQFLQSDQNTEVVALLSEQQQLVDAQHLADADVDASRKQRRIQSVKNRNRYQRLKEIRAELVKHLHAEKKQLEQQLENTQTKLEINKILSSREFSFSLYSGDVLEQLYSQI